MRHEAPPEGSEPPATADHDHAGMDHNGMDHPGAESIEWEDDMVEVNRQTTSATMHWRFLDRTTGADSPAI